MREHHIAPKIAGVYNNSASIKQAVMAGLGITALSRRVVEREIGDGSLAQLAVPHISFQRNFRMVHHANKYITPTLELFMKICHEYSGENYPSALWRTTKSMPPRIRAIPPTLEAVNGSPSKAAPPRTPTTGTARIETDAFPASMCFRI